ncbi:MAG: BrnA antitoxin family protein [bacterium]|nr:BrnA antitoxin family protein [bacterium]
MRRAGETLKEHYDFSRGKRGPIVAPAANKTRITIRLDADIVSWFKEEVHRAGGGNYQSLINDALRRHVHEAREPLEETLRRVLREELRGARPSPATEVAEPPSRYDTSPDDS